ncbi:MAG: DNA replication/repair protein RecF [Chloroflexi bacterium]|nr:DNA replication/repair protein RecF [Chloroflexota bacterium]
MHLTRLLLTNFRNYSHLELDLAPGLTLVQGNNAAGKTNLLEAIFYVATGHSPHAHAERELIRWGAASEPIPFAHVETHLERKNGATTRLEIVLVQANVENTFSEEKSEEKQSGRVSKRIRVNGVAKRALDLLGELTCVLFLPEDLDLVFGSPGDRRRYLDITLSQIDPRYGRALSKYNQVLEQRNGLLREFQDRKFNADELAVWDSQLIEEGAYLIARRAETIERYNKLIAVLHPRLTDAREHLTLQYQSNALIEEPITNYQLPLSETSTHPEQSVEGAESKDPNIAARFARQLELRRARELGAGLTLVGPHRDDVRFLIQRNSDENKIDATIYASRGQGRTIALSLKLAEVELMRAETGEDPVLLLDDMMSELDAPRRAALSQAVIDAPQALITATDLEDFSPEFLARARVYAAENNALTLQQQSTVE